MRKVALIPWGLHAQTVYPARRGIPAVLSDLAEHDLIGFGTETPAIRAFAGQFPAFNRAAFALQVDSDIPQLAAIRVGFGIVFVRC